MKPELLITRRLPERVEQAARAHFEVTVRLQDAPLTVEEARQALRQYDAILPTLGDAFTAEAFDGAGVRTRVLANFGVGYNHIDVQAARAAGVIVTNTPGAVTDATADIAITLMLMTARRAGEGERLVRSGRWQGWQPTQMLGLHVTGKTLGVVGMGRIGRAIAHRGHFGFSMPVIFANRSKIDDSGIPGAQQLSLDEVMAQADIVVISVPGGGNNRHLIGAPQLAAMQRHAILVNIARGDVIDEAALIATLKTGGIAGAGLDVYEHEPHVPAELRAMENVTLLPHLGTAALEVREAMGFMALDNLRAVFDGRPVPNAL